MQMINLNEYINVRRVGVLNGHAQTAVFDLKQDPESPIESDSDSQLIINIPFTQPVKLSSIEIRFASEETRPDTLKVFTNRVSLDFNDVDDSAPDQEFSPVGERNELKFVKFQNLNNLNLFFDNSRNEKTEILRVTLFGSLCQAMNMKEFKPVKDPHE